MKRQTDNKELTGPEIKKKIIEGFLKDISTIEINGFDLCRISPNKKAIFINDNIELQDLQMQVPGIDSFTDFIYGIYASNAPKIIKKHLPFPANEKVKDLPVLSLTPSSENPKIIQINY